MVMGPNNLSMTQGQQEEVQGELVTLDNNEDMWV